jgi:hypothetical protein
MSISMAAEEEELFKACTVISIGNGVRTNFWKDRWLKGQAPKDIAPECFRWAWRKNITVAKALTNRCWMRGLRRMNNETALRQFVELWTQIQQIRLSSHPDQITWRFTSDGQYIVKSAYEMQFCGSYADHIWKKIWGAKAENKCRFFCWLMLQDRLPTADRIIRRGGQTNHICQLCHIREESILHMIATCSFSKSVWTKIAMDYSLQPLQDPGHMTLRSWWQSWVDRGRAESNKHLQVLIYTVWNLWKERCRRVFDNKAMSQVQLTAIIKSKKTRPAGGDRPHGITLRRRPYHASLENLRTPALPIHSGPLPVRKAGPQLCFRHRTSEGVFFSLCEPGIEPPTWWFSLPHSHQPS